MRILLQPSSGKEAMGHFEDTISGGVLVEDLRGCLAPEILEKIEKLGEDRVQVWGVTPVIGDGPKKQWSNLRENDLVLFYANKRFYYFAKVFLKVINKDLAIKLWGFDKGGRTWEDIYFIKEGKQINVPYSPKILGYKKQHVVQGAILLDENQSDDLKNYINKYEELIDEEKIEPTAKEEKNFLSKIKTPRSPEEAEAIIKLASGEIEKQPVRERIKLAKSLDRNPLFSRLVKERAQYICTICGARPFIQKNGLPYAEAHHIDELAKTRIDDPRKMICVCPTCHAVIHHGNDESLTARRRLSEDKQ